MDSMNTRLLASGAVMLSLVACGSSDDDDYGWAPERGGAAGDAGANKGGASGSVNPDAGIGGGLKGGSAGAGGGSAGAGGGAAGAGGGSAGTGGGTAGTGGGTAGAGGSAGNPICLGSQEGSYCGGDSMQNADPNVLYQCPGANKAPTSSKPCPEGCVIEAPGTADHCKVPTTPGGYKLPWKPGVSMTLTQDCNDSCCNDHVNDDKWAWDFANGGGFQIVAARGGTVTHLKINSTSGCGSSSCVDQANFIVIDHGDGTQSVYLHLKGGSLASGVSCGSTVQQGQALANAGTTGWSTGDHLHFQVSQVHTGAATCECGADGKGCGASSVPWGSFWSTATYPTLSITFDEWPDTSNCADRYMQMPASTNQ
jgi:hypothetical protein